MTLCKAGCESACCALLGISVLRTSVRYPNELRSGLHPCRTARQRRITTVAASLAPAIVHLSRRDDRHDAVKTPIAIGLAPDTTAGSGVHAQPTARLARKATDVNQ